MELHQIMIDIIEKLRDQIIDAARNRAYMIQPEEDSYNWKLQEILQPANDCIDITESGPLSCQYRKNGLK